MRTTNTLAIAMAGFVTMAASQALTQEVIRDSQDMSELRGDWVIGATVRAPDESTVGTITDLLIDEQDGTMTAAVIDVGGFLGFGAKSIAVDWDQLQINFDGNEVTLGITPDDADEAPEFAFREREFPPPPAPPAGGGMPN